VGFGGEDAVRFFARHGLVDPAALAHVRGRAGQYARMVPAVPPRYHRLRDGLVLQQRPEGPAGPVHDWHCIAGLGHAPEHIALHAPQPGLLIAGDMLLPSISTNVSVQDVEPEGDPLALFLDALRAMQALPAGTLVLPSHGRPFTGAHARIAQLLAHHDERLAEVLQACGDGPRSAADLLPVLFRRRLDAHQTSFAMGEAIAHLHRLRAQGLLAAEDGADGVRRFRRC
jgi:glyoxylase-like metal-dependent hydrolase (beta-lactamase superfamily II)